MHTLVTQKAILVALTMGSFSAFLIMGAMARHISGQDKTVALVVRVAIFDTDQGGLDVYRDFIERHLFPTLRSVPGYAGAYLGRDPNSGQLISLSFWHSEADALAGEEAVGRAIRGLPRGSAPRPSNVAKYVIEYRDISETLSK